MPSPKNLKDITLRKAIIATCRKMNDLGINQGSAGNVSVRTKRGFLITPSGVAYDTMQPGQIVEMDFDAGYRGDWLPSSEWRMHMDLLKARPEAGAVIHSHAVHASALSCLRKDIPPFHYMIAVTGGAELRCSGYAPFGTQALSDTVLKTLEGRTACLMANHGMICFGPDLDKALGLAVEIETICRQYVIACQAGKPVNLTKKDMNAVLPRFKTYGKQAGELGEDEIAAVEPPTRRDG